MRFPLSRTLLSLLCIGLFLLPVPAHSDETGQSAFTPKLISKEEFVHVWTLGVDGVGDGSDKLVTVDTNPSSVGFGKVISSVSVGGRHEAHQGGLTEDRRHLWVGALDGSKIFVFDVASDPTEPKLVKTISDFEKKSGVVGPHGFHALPGRMLISALSGKDGSGKTALVEYSNDGVFLGTHGLPGSAPFGAAVDVKIDLNRMLTTSFTSRKTTQTPLSEVLADPNAKTRFGSTVVVWDFQARKPLQVLEIPGGPLEIRWALGPRHTWAYTTTALTSKIWGIYRTSRGDYEAVELADIAEGDPLLPVDISLSSDDRYLLVTTFLDGTVRVFDMTKPRRPRLVRDLKVGDQVGSVSQSFDGRRIYLTSSVFSHWDGHGGTDPQFLKSYDWIRKELEPRFEVDFTAAGLGRPQLMSLGRRGFWSDDVPAVSGSPGATRAAAGE